MSTTQIHQETINQQPTIWIVPDALWEKIQPELIIEKTRKKPGRPRHPDRPIFNGLIHMARTGAQWSAFPRELAPKSTAFDRFSQWVEHGAFQKAWSILLEEYDDLIGIEWQWQSADGCIVKAPLGKKGISVKRKTRVATLRIAVNAVANDTF
jgi:transposase